MRLRINEAIKIAKREGKKIKKTDLAFALWDVKNIKAARENIYNLCSGKSKKVDIDAIPIICDKLGVTSDYLFRMTENPK